MKANKKITASKIVKELTDEQQSNPSDLSDEDEENKHDEKNKKRKHSEKSDSPKKTKSKSTKKLFNDDSSIDLNSDNEISIILNEGDDRDHAGDCSYLVFGSSSENESYCSKFKNKIHSTGINKKFKADNDDDDELKMTIVKPSTSKSVSKSVPYPSKSPFKTVRGLAKLASNTTPPLVSKQIPQKDDEDEDRRSSSAFSHSSSKSSISGKNEIKENYFIIYKCNLDENSDSNQSYKSPQNVYALLR